MNFKEYKEAAERVQEYADTLREGRRDDQVLNYQLEHENKETEMKIELLPCPFCGVKAPWGIQSDDGKEGWVECGNCKATGPRTTPLQLAIHDWNRRPQEEKLIAETINAADKYLSVIQPTQPKENTMNSNTDKSAVKTRIIVLDRGFVFVGKPTIEDDGSMTIRGARNIRRWGTTKGLGQLVNGPLPNTILDDGGIVNAPISSVIFTIVCTRDW